MNEKNAARDLGEILGDIDRHCTQAEQSSVPANAETLLRLLLDAAKHLPAIQATANAAKEQAESAFKVANGVARDVVAVHKSLTKTTTTKKAA